MTDIAATITEPGTVVTAPAGVAPAQPDAAESFAGRIFGSYIAGLEVLSIQLGLDLGLYRALDARGCAGPASLPRQPESTNATPASGSNSKPWPATILLSRDL